MLKQWITKLEPVHRARSREEREAVYRFRYAVYYEEYGRQLGSPDHERRWVTDAEDEKDYTTILYTGSAAAISGTVRLRNWPPGEVPEHDLHELSMDVFPDIASRHTGEIGRLMIRRGMRGKLLLASLLRAVYEGLCEQGTELMFLYCSPGLIPYYRKLGCRPFGGRLVPTPDGVMVPLVNVLSDYAYYRRVGCLLAPLVRRYFGPGRRAPLDLEPYREILEAESSPVSADPEKVWGELQEAFADPQSDSAPLLESVPPEVLDVLTDKGFLLSVTEGTMVTHKGFGEQEMYLILDGLFEVTDGDRRLRTMGKGELFGELAFFLPAHRRTATVSAVTDGRLLVLRGSAVRRLIESDPKTAALLLLEIGAMMARRMAEGPAAEPDEETAEG